MGKKVIILGTTEMTKLCLESFQEAGWEIAGLVTVPKEERPLNSVDLSQIALKHQIPYLEITDINGKESEEFLQSLDADFIFSTWPWIIEKNILKIPKYGVLGSHGTELPHNRGRHHLHWLITLGFSESYMSIFKMKEGVDDGNILIQERYSCEYEKGIEDVYASMVAAAKRAVLSVAHLLDERPLYSGKEQNEEESNYWRKRTIYDTIIDFRMTATDIVRLVKSFNGPYKGARILYKDHVIRLKDAKLYSDASLEKEEIQRMEFGKIYRIQKDELIVKASEGLVRLVALDSLEEIAFGKYILPPTQYLFHYRDELERIIDK